MDPETKALLERSRKRRELLNQRIDMPKALPRKRAVIGDENPENILTPQMANDDDSPKRQCVRDVERQIKPDTPAIQGIQSRIKGLAAAKCVEDQENTNMPVPVPRKSISSPPLERKGLPQDKPVPTHADGTPSSSLGRKGRFAALAQNINSWEDDITSHVQEQPSGLMPHHYRSTFSHPNMSLERLYSFPTPNQDPSMNTTWVEGERRRKRITKPETKSSPKKPYSRKEIDSPTKKIGTSVAPAIPAVETKAVTAVASPKTTPAPPTPRSPALNNFSSRSSPLRASKVELNRSPKPFTPTKAVASPTKSSPYKVTKSSSDDVLTTSKTEKSSSFVTSSKSCETLSSDKNAEMVKNPVVGKKTYEPVSKPTPAKLAPWEKRVQTPKGRPSMEPSKRPMSAKLAHFEQQIVNNTPKSGLSSSSRVERTRKQECTPVLSASVPPRSITKDSDPSEMPISQRMSRMQEKLANSPLVKGGGGSASKSKDEPTAYPVGARMSAWEDMSSSQMVSDIKQVNPGEVSLKKPPPPPPAPAKIAKTDLTPQKSFKDSIQQRSHEITGRIQEQTQSSKSPVKKVSSPLKSSAVRSPSKVIHSPSKLSKGTKVFQHQLIKKSQKSETTCSTLAAQSRAARMAELDDIQNRWKNGILRDDSSSDESKPSEKKIVKTATPKREQARNKAREEFASKLTEIGLDDEAGQTTPKAASVSKGNVSGSGKKTSSQTSSIYALIRKRDETQNTKEESDKKVTFHDSFFEDDDETMRKVPRSASLRAAQENPVDSETFKKPQTPTKKEEQQQHQATDSDIATDTESVTSSRTSLEIDDDDISLKGFVSEAVRKESTRMIRKPQQHTTSQSSLDSYDDDCDSNNKMEVGTSSNGYRPDVESMDDDDDDESNNGAVADLLDEAMMDSSDASSAYDPDMDPNNVVMRKKQQQHPQPSEEEYDPDMDINNVVLRRKPRPTNTDSPVAKKTRSHAMAISSTDDDDDDDSDRPYSLTAYRKSVNVNLHHMEPVVRKSKYSRQEVMEEDIQMPSAHNTRYRNHKDDRQAVQERVKELQELVQQEQNVIMQTSNALNKCCMGNAYFAGSAEQVECNRLLLIACQKRQVYMKEIQRIKQTSELDASGQGPRGSLTISDIRLPLKKEFVKRIGTSHDTITHFFILLIRNGCQVICTQMLSTHDPMMRGSLDFPNLIKINGISGDFKLAVDIYGMSVSKEVTLKDKKRKTPKKGKGYASTLESPGGPTAVRTTSFSHVACVDLTMKCLNKTSFHLERLPQLSPLYGQIFMRFKCLMESHVEEKGFLTMFEDVSGFGAWHRRWCVLSSNKLCVWKYPDDETRKDPMTMIDLKRCVTEKVGLVPRDICARPNTFEMVTVRQPLKGEHDTLITKTHSTVTTVRHQMSADTKEERIMWCNKINRTLANLRTWNPDTLRPVKPPHTTPSSSSSYHH